MSTNMATIRTHQPEYTIPAKRPSYWYCKSLDCRLSAPSDLWGLERETLLTIKAELEKENNRFELIRKQHARTVSQLADDITKKFFEYQQARIKAIRYIKQETNHE